MTEREEHGRVTVVASCEVVGLVEGALREAQRESMSDITSQSERREQSMTEREEHGRVTVVASCVGVVLADVSFMRMRQNMLNTTSQSGRSPHVTKSTNGQEITSTVVVAMVKTVDVSAGDVDPPIVASMEGVVADGEEKTVDSIDGGSRAF